MTLIWNEVIHLRGERTPVLTIWESLYLIFMVCCICNLLILYQIHLLPSTIEGICFYCLATSCCLFRCVLSAVQREVRAFLQSFESHTSCRLLENSPHEGWKKKELLTAKISELCYFSTGQCLPWKASICLWPGITKMKLFIQPVYHQDRSLLILSRGMTPSCPCCERQQDWKSYLAMVI